MKKLLVIALSVLSIGFAASAAEAKTSNSAAVAVTANAAGDPQIRVQIGGRQRRNRRVVRRVITTRRARGNRVVVRRRVVTRRRPIYRR